MNRKEFRDLLRRYLNDTCTIEERQLVDQLYDLIGEERPTLNLEGTPTLEFEAGLEEKMWAHIASKTFDGHAKEDIETTMGSQHTETKSVRLSRIWQVGIAASLLLLIAWGLDIFFQKDQNIAFVLENTDATTTKTYKLSDSTIVRLKGKSKLEITADFNQSTRTVYLKGEAFFEVTRNTDKPFFVLAGDVVTKVLGTSFLVKNTEGGKSVAVEVVSGKVSVYNKKIANKKEGEKGLEKNGVVLTPNLKVTYFKTEAHFVTSLVERPVLVQSEKNTTDNKSLDAPIKFHYVDTPVATVLKELEQAYGIQIVLANDKINACPLTANLTKQSLFEKLDLVCAILKASYEVQGTSILITGRGCE